MISPIILLAFLLALIGTGASGFLYGQHTQKNADKAAQVDAVKRALDDANANTLIDMQAAASHAKAEADARNRAGKLSAQVKEVIREIPMPASCDWDSRTFVLLGDTVKFANGDSTSADKLPDAVHKTP